MTSYTSFKDLPIHNFFKEVEISQWQPMAFLAFIDKQSQILSNQKALLHKQYKDSLNKIHHSNQSDKVQKIVTSLLYENLSVSMIYLKIS